jgi:hypothetical protein
MFFLGAILEQRKMCMSLLQYNYLAKNRKSIIVLKFRIVPYIILKKGNLALQYVK